MQALLKRSWTGFSLADTWTLAGEQVLSDRSRWALWIPVFIGAGIGVYFALPWEPAPFAGAGALAILAAGVYLCRKWAGVQLSLIALVFVAAGFTAVHWRTAMQATPLIATRLGPVSITGQLIELERQDDGVRYLMAPETIERLAPDKIPARVRLRLSGKARANAALQAGDSVRLRAVLMPPPGPVTPGGFDYGRMLWFERIGGVGFIITPPQLLNAAPPSGFLPHLMLRLTVLRDRMTARIMTAIPGDAGVMSAALMTGDRAAISGPVNMAMINSGLAHLISISGLHMGMVAGILFFSLRAALALHERIALRYPIKKWSAAFALFGLWFYLLISGASIPAQRSFMMTGMVLAAVILDRSAISMRTIMLAASTILLLSPESLHSASFQMSFAAVTALIAFYEVYGRQFSISTGEDGWFLRSGKYAGAMLASSLVAGLATAPFAAYHFNRFTVYGLLANMLAVPLTGIVVMPCAVAAFILMPFGQEWLALLPMGWGVDGVLRIAFWVAALPGAVIGVGQGTDIGFLMMVFGGLWLCLWERQWRRAGLIPILMGAALWMGGASRPPDILIEGNGRLMAVRNPAGQLVANTTKAARHSAQEWARQDGLMGQLAAAHDDPFSACDTLGCIFNTRRGESVAFAQHPGALSEDCAHAGILVASFPVRNCRGPRLVIDIRDLHIGGAHAVWFSQEAVQVENVAQIRGQRPWVPVNDASLDRVE